MSSLIYIYIYIYGLSGGEGYIRLDEPVSLGFTLHKIASADITRIEITAWSVMGFVHHLAMCYRCGGMTSAVRGHA